jgi:hypothetical protein
MLHDVGIHESRDDALAFERLAEPRDQLGDRIRALDLGLRHTPVMLTGEGASPERPVRAMAQLVRGLVDGPRQIRPRTLVFRLRRRQGWGYRLLLERIGEHLVQGAHVLDFHIPQDLRRQIRHGIGFVLRW